MLGSGSERRDPRVPGRLRVRHLAQVRAAGPGAAEPEARPAGRSDLLRDGAGGAWGGGAVSRGPGPHPAGRRRGGGPPGGEAGG